ncbi:Oidioi.mRNA.OKI2018_I69.XSR.g13274.t1.cds [Oikopleura dioica]|uniref:Oidioi.mRNA.OKI2018_I69.XSR.g13274.t1.cds n=1 Tax=Oikopleura dioica TaxID=34765 RepID=A0ABN7SA53_OIKDI|nr:Oidioi.mRNA.OKI2018_I69.XSR.g13274.t1.cds [Oikopleura dioica]
MKTPFFALFFLEVESFGYWEKKVKESISELYRFSKQLQKCSCGDFYKQSSSIWTMLAPSCDCCWESTCLCPMKTSSLESVERMQQLTNATDKERLYEMSTSEFKNFTKIFDDLQHNMLQILINGVENRKNGQCWKCRPVEPECRFPPQFLELNASREVEKPKVDSFVKPIIIDPPPVMLKMHKEVKTNLDEKLIEDLAQRSTRDTTAENAGASGEGAVPTSTVQSTTSTREYGDNEDYLEEAVSSSPAGLSLTAGNSGVLQAGYDAIPIAIIVIGAFVSLISLIGLLSLNSDGGCAKFFQRFYSIILILLVILELSCGIAAYVKKDNITKILNDEALDSINEDWEIEVLSDDGSWSLERNPTAVAWQVLQEEFNCCGFNNYTDWNNATSSGFPQYVEDMQLWLSTQSYNLTAIPVPDSCCDVNEFGCGLIYSAENIEDDIQTIGCKNSVESFLTSNIAIIAGAAVGKVFLVVVGVWILHGLVQLTRNIQLRLDFENFNPARKTSRIIVDEKNLKEKVVLLLTDYRTGSTLLGEIFSRHEDAFYMFEPDHAVLWDPTTQVNWLMEYFRCEFVSLSESKIENNEVNWSKHRDFVFSHKTARLCKPPFCGADFSNDVFKCMKCQKVDVSLAREVCKRNTPVIKTVRTKDMEKFKTGFLENQLEPRIVINVRDPRAVVHSRRQLAEVAGVSLENMKNYCEYKVKQKKMVEEDPWFGEKTTFVKYEELALDPVREATRIYDFTGFAQSSSAKKIMVQLTHSSHNNDAYGTVRNATKTVNAWRNNLNEEDISLMRKIEDVCSEMMRLFKYEPLIKS